jgi:hypothetical protein
VSRKGYAPWADDIAADWLAELMEDTQLPQKVRRALEQPVNDVSSRVVRAAAGVLLAIGYNYVWPVEDIDSDFELAANQLEKCLTFETNEHFRSLMEDEVRLLRAKGQMMLLKYEGQQTADLWLRWLTPAQIGKGKDAGRT